MISLDRAVTMRGHDLYTLNSAGLGPSPLARRVAAIVC